MTIHDDDKSGNHDKALSFHWKARDQAWLDRLGLPPASSKGYAQARASILLEAHLIGRAEPGRVISYSRRREFYTGGQRYKGLPYTYGNVVGSINEATRLGWLDDHIATPGTRGRQSTIRATDKLLEAIDQPLPVIFDPIETVRLRDMNKHLIDYQDTALTDLMRKHMAEINEAITSASVDLPAPDVEHGEHTIRCGNHVLYPDQQSLHRVFNRGRFSRGGRLYGGWWQQARKVDREHLTINGDETVELDYPSLHPSMLYAKAGKTLAGDPYIIDGWERKLVKVAFNVLVNARTPEQGLRAIAERIGGEGSFSKARNLIEAIKIKHAPIADAFGSDAGVKLQRTDSDMAEHVLLTLIRKGIVTLPIHDSFITREQDKGALLDAMADALEKHVLSANRAATSTGYADSIPQMVVSPLSLLVLPPSSGPQLDLFGGCGLSVPFHEISVWSRGLVPDGVRSAVLHELKRRGLRQDDLALKIGVSRPQLVNVLRGRFGAGPKVAAGLRDFIFEGADTVGLVAD